MKVLEHLGEGNIKQRQGTQHQLSGVDPLQYTITALVSSLHMNPLPIAKYANIKHSLKTIPDTVALAVIHNSHVDYKINASIL